MIFEYERWRLWIILGPNFENKFWKIKLRNNWTYLVTNNEITVCTWLFIRWRLLHIWNYILFIYLHFSLQISFRFRLSTRNHFPIIFNMFLIAPESELSSNYIMPLVFTCQNNCFYLFISEIWDFILDKMISCLRDTWK